MTRIIAAAIEYKGNVWPGDRHGHITMYLVKTGYLNSENRQDYITNSVQGFIDENYEFHDRRAALEITLESGQVEEDKLLGSELTSEDLW